METIERSVRKSKKSRKGASVVVVVVDERRLFRLFDRLHRIFIQSLFFAALSHSVLLCLARMETSKVLKKQKCAGTRWLL